jgi:hypothetical protein
MSGDQFGGRAQQGRRATGAAPILSAHSRDAERHAKQPHRACPGACSGCDFLRRLQNSFWILTVASGRTRPYSKSCSHSSGTIRPRPPHRGQSSKSCSSSSTSVARATRKPGSSIHITDPAPKQRGHTFSLGMPQKRGITGARQCRAIGPIMLRVCRAEPPGHWERR